jgi:hypothetical protein
VTLEDITRVLSFVLAGYSSSKNTFLLQEHFFIHFL